MIWLLAILVLYAGVATVAFVALVAAYLIVTLHHHDDQEVDERPLAPVLELRRRDR